MVYNIGLILEGGGMRGVYTAGVLDCFIDRGIEIDKCYGVSAGAINGMNYIAKQKGRTFRCMADYIQDKEYCSLQSLLTTGNMFGVDLLYNRIPNELDPFDYDAFYKSEKQLIAVLSDVEKGKPVYKRILDMRKDISYLRASSSLPIVSQIVEIKGRKYLDGGIMDSIPIKKALKDGCKKNIVILTRHKGYEKNLKLLTAFLEIYFI